MRARISSLVTAAILVLSSMVAIGIGTQGANAQDGERTAAVYSGSCSRLEDVLSEVRALSVQEGGVETAFRTISVSLADLVADGSAVVVTDEAGDPVACGDVTGSESAEDIYIGLAEQNSSGYSGVAWLRAREDRTQVSVFLAQGLAGTTAGGDDTSDDDDGPPPPPDDDDTTDDDDGPPSGGATYTSPSYGYTVTYDPTVWQVDQESSEPSDSGPIDFIGLWNGLSYVSFLGQTAAGVNALDCVDFFERQLPTRETNSDVEPRLDDAGDEIRGGNARRAWVALNYTFTADNGDSADLTLYIECRQLPDDVLVIFRQNVPQRAYDQQVGPRDDLLAGFDEG
ncbi:MAG TPA: hypothetical protein VIL01_16490 [Thermomicrobiales bacterium]